jgi:hypothetical protein
MRREDKANNGADEGEREIGGDDRCDGHGDPSCRRSVTTHSTS